MALTVVLTVVVITKNRQLVQLPISVTPNFVYKPP